MKTKNKLLKGLLIGTFLLATNFLVAQTNTSPFQTVCAGSVEPYLINPPTANSTYNWTLPTGGSISSGQGTDSITVDWGLVAGGPHTLTVIETDVNGCVGTPITVEVTITPNTTPTFTAVGPYCSGEVIPDLPTTSNNGVTGTWSPAISNTATGTYTFTPTAGQCATTQTLTITITPNTTPTFTPVGPYCSGEVIPDLPTTSNNGVTGTWSPAISNTATTTYTFTPTAGLCAPTQTLTITITPNTTPTFTPVGPYCTGAIITDLPITSSNGVTGTWAPASVSNTATTTYTFTPAAGLCSPTFDLTITINPLPTTGPINHW
jgi:hypothetical protein